MKYEPVKIKLLSFIKDRKLFTILFYKLLHLLLLRAWHIRGQLRKLKKDIPDDAAILDAGSGFGQYTYFMAGLSSSWKIKGIDIQQEHIDMCNRFFSKTNKKNRVGFEKADLTKYRQDNTYNLILCVDVMEHIEADRQVFENYFNSLKAKGYLLISTPSDQGGSDVHDEDEHSFIEEHVRDGYGIAEIKEKLQKAGFSNIAARYTYGTPGRISWKLSMKYPLTLINLHKLFVAILPFYYLVSFPFSLLLNYLDVIMRHRTGTGLIVTAEKNTAS